MGNWCVWNDNPSFSGNLSSISKHRNSSLVNTQFGSFAHKSHFIFPISPWSLHFPQKQGLIFFPFAVDYPSLKLTVSQEWVSFLPLTLEGFRYRLPFGDFKPSLSGAFPVRFGKNSYVSRLVFPRLRQASRTRLSAQSFLRSDSQVLRWWYPVDGFGGVKSGEAFTSGGW